MLKHLVMLAVVACTLLATLAEADVVVFVVSPLVYVEMSHL